MQLVDLLLKEVEVPVGENYFPVDLAIRRREINAGDSYSVAGSVEDLGDTQVYYGLEEFDASGMRYAEGQVYETTFNSVTEIDSSKAFALLKQGYLAVKVKEGQKGDLHQLPILVLKSTDSFPAGWQTGGVTNFFLAKEGQLQYAIVNGYLIDLNNPQAQKFKQRIY